jgi:N4-gp56 family major capsid protein
MPGQVWLTNSLGGYMWSPQLSKTLRYAVQPLCKYRQFADVKDAAVQGKNKGDAFHWNVYSDVATAGGTLTEGTAIPQTNFVITQGTMTITEYGNSVPYTSKLDDLSEQPVREIIQKVLKNDAKKAFDKASNAQFKLTPLYVVPTAGTSTTAITLTTNGTATLTNNVALGTSHVKLIIDEMKERNIPPYEADDYFCIARPRTFRGIKDQLETLHQYTSEGFGMIANGEIGRYENTRFVEQTNIAAAAWTNSKSDTAHFFGNDTVAEGIVLPEEMRGMIPTDYGRSRGVAWYYLGGFGLVHTVPTQARVIQWGSAA